MMMKEIEQVIMQVCEILKKEKKENVSTEIKKIGAGLDELWEQLNQGRRPRQELYDYLNSLDFEVVKVLQTIMYVGRDYSRTEDIVEVYELKRAELDERGWKTKSIEINQIIQKRPLGDYLMRGWDMVK